MAAPMLLLALWRHSLEPCCGETIDPVALLDAHVDTLSRSLAMEGKAK
jgi:hypothetical protein